MAKVRLLSMERPDDNPLVHLPIENSFLSRFVIQPVCYTRAATFVGIVEWNHVSYSCILSAGLLNGEEITRYNQSDQRTFSVPVRSVGKNAS